MGANARKRAVSRATIPVTGEVPASQHMARREAAQRAGRPLNVEELLYRVGKEHRYIHVVTTRRDRFIRQAREAGATWADIGAQLGISRQGARQAFEGNRSEAEGGSRRRATQPARVSSAGDES